MIFESDFYSFIQMLNPTNTAHYNRLVAHAIGVNEAIIYATLISKTVYYNSNNMLDEDGFFYATANDIQGSTALTQRQQETAIKRLVSLGLIETVRKGIPAKKYFRIIQNKDLLINVLSEGEKAEMAFKNKKSADKPLYNQFRGKRETRNDKNANQEITKSQIKDCENRETRSDKNAKHSYKSKEKNLKEINHIDQSAESGEMIDEIESYRELILDNIEYDILTEQYNSRKDMIDEIVEIMLECICSTKQRIVIGGEDLPKEVVKSRMLKIDSSHIEYILECLKKSTTKKHNIKAYLRAVIYNAPTTMDNYYTAEVNHMMYGAQDESQ